MGSIGNENSSFCWFCRSDGTDRGRYFGFVTGGLLPVAHAAQWLADTWNQNSALYLMSPVAAKPEGLCERWLARIFGLPKGMCRSAYDGSI